MEVNVAIFVGISNFFINEAFRNRMTQPTIEEFPKGEFVLNVFSKKSRHTLQLST